MGVGSGALLGLLARIMIFEYATERIVAKRFAWVSPARFRSHAKSFFDRRRCSQACCQETLETRLSATSHAQRQR